MWIEMNKQAAQKIIAEISKTCKIPKQDLLITKQSTTNKSFEIHIEKSLQETEWLGLEEIIANHTLRLKLADNLLIIY